MSIPSRFSAEPGSRRGLSVAFVAGSMLALAASSPSMADDWQDRSTMTGDWEGNRSRLAAQGVKITGDYSGETVYITPEPKHIHVFNAESGERLNAAVVID